MLVILTILMLVGVVTTLPCMTDMFLIETTRSTALPEMLRLVQLDTYSLQYRKLLGISLHMDPNIDPDSLTEGPLIKAP